MIDVNDADRRQQNKRVIKSPAIDSCDWQFDLDEIEVPWNAAPMTAPDASD